MINEIKFSDEPTQIVDNSKRLGRPRIAAMGSRIRKRPKQFDWARYHSMLSRDGLELREIAAIMGYAHETIARRCQKDFGKTLAEKFPEFFSSTQEFSRPISWKIVGNYCSVGCTVQEICGLLKTTPANLERRCMDAHNMTFGEFQERAFANTRAALRQKQIKEALGSEEIKDPDGVVVTPAVRPSTPMLLHLGKHILGQVERTETKIEVKGVLPEQKTRLLDLVRDVGAEAVDAELVEPKQ